MLKAAIIGIVIAVGITAVALCLVKVSSNFDDEFDDEFDELHED